jgi:hypothetical protein
MMQLSIKTCLFQPFVSVKREYPFHRWEPIYIGGKNDPLYSEALSWEGLQDKMTQVRDTILIRSRHDGTFRCWRCAL